ncbi:MULTISPECIES: peptide-methionine (S)-S-oxide reductase MsrA [Rhizobium]|uniref:Peptide methionine sulfoxide reductase MsrA n=1 Tax=Rhizobium rhododendri TaxID=2506430 RepID=A0ABY8IEQ2_9HYPH|nr:MULTISPECIES: peptide-methionine (S)-S-oxide reductase MsrA [Rhizobium]MBZ5759270.1 peptide-methionine (S)-S-oxide reductase MsrA [Rhizobium sp. VS19-DR96]MBZ5763899.1 peptide-methionine (S)-S-oxide reductase MsrA [Rhizobium sp. VS19-DR129.2]MBZ5771443.1 peptide-methionine (S)-S-oxide reductase MsrA [Rhizobium sp. VS19-DRK62.2]MBZ5783870.1 peptide-methionine (S)-S-oxide reductase MsrA [Rhizobium sp. VS19-DR121]MBZ5801456.1 peptide-methionine (S)-S-oxide reductase MsrA [Rhizobium sp. VS19-DR
MTMTLKYSMREALSRYGRRAGTAVAVLLVGGTVLHFTPSQAGEAREIPKATIDAAPGSGTETIALAGGCFWGVQGVFQHVDGVVSAVSGYAGGAKNTAEYETVSTGSTGHAETVKVVFDPHKISLGHLLQIYFSVAHDPTELNRQGPDSGTQYRSAIFPTTPEQARVAKAYIDQLNKAHVFGEAVVTKIEPGKSFYPAETYHQNFLTTHPTYPYIAINDIPKIDDLKRMFPKDYRAEPVLVTASN